MSKKNGKSIFGKTRSKLSVLPVIFSSILAAGAMAGTGVSVWQVSKNYKESAEFSKSFNARINVDPVAYNPEGLKSDKQIATDNLKESAARLSAWLKYNGAQSYDVSYELTDPNPSHEIGYSNSGWLTAHFTVDKINKKHPSQDDDKIDNDPYLSYFANGGFNTNNKSIVYRWASYDKELSQGPEYTILDFKDIFALDIDLKAKDNPTKTLVDKDGKNGVLFKINKPDVVKTIYNDLKAANEDLGKKQEEKQLVNDYQKPRLYIVNNLEQMLNEMNYHLTHYAAFSDGQHKIDGLDYYQIYDGSEYQTFAKTIRAKDAKNKDRTGDQPKKLGTVRIHESESKLTNGEGLNYLDLSKYSTVEASFLNKYVDKIYKADSKDYEKFFPDKITDTYHNDEASKKSAADVKLSYAWYPTSTSTEADKYLGNQVNYGFKAKVVNITLSGETPTTLIEQYKQSFTSREVPPKFVDTIFGGNNLIGILSLGFLIYLIALGIILGLLYRTTGVMSWICMMFMLSMTGLIATIGSKIISLSLLFGLFGMSLVGFLAALALCGRIKRRICSNEDTSVAVIKGLKKSLLPIVDISFIALLFGICFTYIAPLNLNPLGVVFIVGGFATFISMYLINGLLILLFFNNGLTMNRFRFLGRPNNKANDALAQSNSYVPSSLDATKLEFAFYDKVSASKFGLINLKTLITLCVFGALLIAGIIVFSVKGLTSSSLFHSSMCVTIISESSPIAFLQSKGFNYSYFTHTGNMWYFYCDVPSDEIIQAIKGEFGDYAQFGNIVGNTNKDILNFALLSILITTICASVYTGIRSNWTAFVPMLAGSMLVPLLMLGVGSIAQIKFDENVVLGFALAVAFNTLIANTMIASINEAWFRKESYNNDELKFIVTTAAKNNLLYILICGLGYALCTTFFGVCAPLGLTSVTWLMVIGGLVTIIVTPILVTYLLYWFLVIRAKLLTKRANRLASKVVVNLDEIDEQSIEGINKFTKVKAYAKKQTGENK